MLSSLFNFIYVFLVGLVVLFASLIGFVIYTIFLTIMFLIVYSPYILIILFTAFLVSLII